MALARVVLPVPVPPFTRMFLRDRTAEIIKSCCVKTIGGLYYSGSMGADAKVGPGFATIGYQYQSMPFGGGMADLILSTDQYRIGYRMSF